MEVFSKYKLLAVHEEVGLLYHKGKLYKQELKTKESPQLLCKLPLGGKKKYMVNFRLLERMFRLEPRIAAYVEEGFVVSCAGVIYKLDIQTGKISNELSLRQGMNNPLSFTHTKEGTLMFGEYFSNNSNEEVCVFERLSGKWEKIFAFPEKTIYHIHGIVVSDEGYYILTGDDDDESAIWFTDDHFKTVKMIVGGSQEYRTCVAFPTLNGLIYATDTPLKKNNIYRLSIENGIWKNEMLCEIPGPCIYGTSRNGKKYFATSVEPDARYEDTLRYCVTYKLGVGVKNRFSHIIEVDENNKVTEIGKFKKDILPMLLFQFGNVQFPDGDEDCGLYLTPISVEKHDGHTLKYEG